MARRSRLIRAPVILGAAAAILSCICCVGGLIDALPAPYAIGIGIAALVLALTAAYLGVTRARRRFRAVRRVVVGYLDDVLTGDVESARRWLTGGGRAGRGPAELAIVHRHASPLAAYRITNFYFDFLSSSVEVTVQLRFDDGSDRFLQLVAVREGNAWRIVHDSDETDLW